MFNTSKILAVLMAHPDDAEIHCLGTILKLMQLGYESNVIVISKGNRRIKDNANNLTSIREKETYLALKQFNIKVFCLDFEDGNITLNINLISKIEEILGKINPSVLISHPTIRSDHQDHFTVGTAALNISRRLNINSLLQAKPYYLSDFRSNCHVDITDVYDLKLQAIRKHISQENKYYLKEEYIKFIHQINSLEVGHQSFSKGKLFESFLVQKLVF